MEMIDRMNPLYHIIFNEDSKKLKVECDDDGLVKLGKGDKIIGSVEGTENIDQVLMMIQKLRRDVDVNYYEAK